MLIEMSLHLVQPYVNTTLSAPVAAGVQNATVASTAGMYTNCQIIVGSGSDREAVTVTSIVGNTFSANFANAHSSGEVVWGATFPAQQPTDPLFTQPEMLGYLSRAQNEFLSKVPIIYAMFYQNVAPGIIFQSTPVTATQIDRIAGSSLTVPITTLVRSGNVVTATTVNPHGLGVGSTPYVYGPEDSSFVGTFEITAVPSPTTLVYTQYAADAATTGGQLLYWVRLYEITQEELSLQDRSWRNNYIGIPNAWFEDRAGLYQFGLNGKPAVNFPLELLCAIRDTDTLGLADGFLVPDMMLHYVKYKALEYAFSKDGVKSDPIRAAYCADRFNKGVMACQRWIGAMSMEVAKR